MTSEMPILLFPDPESSDRDNRPGGYQKFSTPPITRQYDRLQPMFSVLQEAFDKKHLLIQTSPVGINPELALVFEVIGSVESFFTAVKHFDGFEWMFEQAIADIKPDEDFHKIKEGKRVESELHGKLYCIMSNQVAMTQLISLWDRYRQDNNYEWKRGLTGLRNIFDRIKNIRKWNASDRVSETNVLEYWSESLNITSNQKIKFEIELFFRGNDEKRRNAISTIGQEISRSSGQVITTCLIPEINYHSMLVELPRDSIANLINNYNEIALARIDDIMFFRPTPQATFISPEDNDPLTDAYQRDSPVGGEPVIALFDGMPLQNHTLLKGRIIIDDPDDYQEGYESKYRKHGTGMSSLIIFGDLTKNDFQLDTPLYVRPVLKPEIDFHDNFHEVVPNDELFIDVIHRAIKRMIEGENGNPPAAPEVKVINFSIGDSAQPLTSIMSPLARLLDYLSYKYKILFIISAGNHPEEISKIPVDFMDLSRQTIAERGQSVFSTLCQDLRNIRVLSPAESLNNLTIGALYQDSCEVSENARQILAESSGLPSPISSFGPGYLSAITPDLFYIGGRKFLCQDTLGRIRWVESAKQPGCKVAAPFNAGTESGHAYSVGTSNAAALISHEAGKCLSILQDIFISETGRSVPNSDKALLLKAMLTHGASWDSIKSQLADALGCSEKRLAGWLGNGIPDIERVESCTINRVTLIGRGELSNDQGHIYKLPLPIDFSKELIKRRLFVTLAYFTPIEPKLQTYRTSRIWFNVNDQKNLVPDRQNTDWRSVQRGTLQHEIFSGDKAVVWNNDEINIKVNCRSEAGMYKKEILPYCMFVTFEVAEGIDIDVYSRVSNMIKLPVPVSVG